VVRRRREGERQVDRLQSIEGRRVQPAFVRSLAVAPVSTGSARGRDTHAGYGRCSFYLLKARAEFQLRCCLLPASRYFANRLTATGLFGVESSKDKGVGFRQFPSKLARARVTFARCARGKHRLETGHRGER
jgi:hypothetical protein